MIWQSRRKICYSLSKYTSNLAS